MDLPNNLKIKGIFVQGGAFKAKLIGNDYPRYYFVLNYTPSSHDIVLITTSTTSFDSHRVCGDEFHIPVSVDEYSEFTKNCMICLCGNNIRKIPYNKFLEIVGSGDFEMLTKLPDNLMQKIISSVRKNKVIETKIKKMICPPDEQER